MAGKFCNSLCRQMSLGTRSWRMDLIVRYSEVNCFPLLFLMMTIEIIFRYCKLWENILSNKSHSLLFSLTIFPSLLLCIASPSNFFTISYKNKSNWSFCLSPTFCCSTINFPFPVTACLQFWSLRTIMCLSLLQSLLSQASFPPLFLFSLSQPHLQLCWLMSHCLQACSCIFYIKIRLLYSACPFTILSPSSPLFSVL